MEDDELQVDPDYKRGFNLAYTLQTQGGEEHYKDLQTLAEHYPDLKQQTLFKGMEAGKAQAVSEQENMMSDMYRDSLVTDYSNNRDEILDQPYYDGHAEKVAAVEQQQKDDYESTRPMTPEEQKEHFDAQEEFEKREAKGLTAEQQKELADHEKWMDKSQERKDFKEASRRIKTEGHENSEAVERGDFETKEQKEEREYVEKMQELRKSRGKDRSR